jgi:predicted nucleic acid-binding protein
MRPPLFAVDTNFLLGLVEAPDAARDALAIIRKRSPGAIVLAPERTLAELSRFAATPSSGRQPAAKKALADMVARGIQPALLTDLQAALADSIAGKLITQGIIPASEHNDAVILAEAAVLGSQILITSDTHLRDADRTRLALALQASDVPVVVVCTPREIVRQFAPRR